MVINVEQLARVKVYESLEVEWNQGEEFPQTSSKHMIHMENLWWCWHEL